jgi:hypothetical protein
VSAESEAYEELTRDLVARLTERGSTITVRLDRDVRNVRGMATSHQIDVLWQYTSALSPGVQTVLFECRKHKNPIKQKDLLAFKGVIDDVAAYVGEDRFADVHGVMVTYTGYQSGARDVADTYGIDVLELREPNDVDFAGRASIFKVTAVVRTPMIVNVGIEPANADEVDSERMVGGLLQDFELEHADGVREALADVLTRGVLSSLGEPARPMERVVRRFDPPVRLLLAGDQVTELVAVAADVGEAVAEEEIIIDARTRVARVLRDHLTDARIWFAHDGTYWSTD